MSEKYAIMDGDTVVNVMLWDGVTPTPAQGSCVPCGDTPVGIGWRRVDETWIAPEPAPEPVRTREEVDELREQAYGAPGGAYAIYLKFQMGIASEQDWQDAISAVQEQFPYPDE